MTGDVIRLAKDGFAVTVSPQGGAILSAHWKGIPILAPTPSPGLASRVFGAEACFPLLPFGNRIEHNGFRFEGHDHSLSPNTADPLVLHGDGWLRPWTILRQDQHSLVFQYRQDASDTSPFAYEAMETIAIRDGCLTLSLSVVNRAGCTLPYGLGFHPYFPRTPRTRLFARAERCWSERENHLPGIATPLPKDLDFSEGATLPERWLNNAFDGWDGKSRIEWPETGLSVCIDAGGGLDHFVLYAPSAIDGFFCFEPMSHRPNAHHAPDGGLVPLTPGEELSGTITLRCQVRIV